MLAGSTKQTDDIIASSVAAQLPVSGGRHSTHSKDPVSHGGEFRARQGPSGASIESIHADTQEIRRLDFY